MRKDDTGRFTRLFSHRNLAVLCVVLLGLTLIPLVVLSFYNHPCADDYNYGLYAAQAVRAGGSPVDVVMAAARKTVETYRNWQGTFSAVFLMSLHPAVFGEQVYVITPYLMIGSLLFSTFFFLKTLCVGRLRMPKADWVILSCAVSFFSVQFAPSAFEGFFWFNGSVFYTFFHSLCLCLFAFVLKLQAAGTRLSATAQGPSKGAAAADLLAAALLSFFIGGGNYPTALLTCVALLAALLWSFVKKAPLFQRLGLLACVLLEMGAFFFSVIAPGNAVRQGKFDTHPGAVEAIWKALISAVQAVLEYTTIPMLLALLVLTPILYRCAARLPFRFRFPLLAPLAAVCVLGVQMTPPIYAMSHTGASRMDDLYYYTYCLLALAVVFYVCGWFSHRFPGLSVRAEDLDRARPAFVLSLAALFCISFLCLPQLRSVASVSAWRSLKNGEAQAYHQQMLARLELYRDPDLLDVVVEPLTARPELLLPSKVPSVSPDPESTTNKRVAKFYNKNTVRERAE